MSTMTIDAVASNGSLQQQLRDQREKQLKAHTLTLELPGWSGMMYVRYGSVPWDTITKIATLDGTNPDAQLKANLDMLIAATEAILVKENNELVSLADALRKQGEQVQGEIRFDSQLATVLGFKSETARQTVLQAFAGCVSPELSIASQAGKISEWMTGISQEVDDTLMGGSQSSRR